MCCVCDVDTQAAPRWVVTAEQAEWLTRALPTCDTTWRGDTLTHCDGIDSDPTPSDENSSQAAAATDADGTCKAGRPPAHTDSSQAAAATDVDGTCSSNAQPVAPTSGRRANSSQAAADTHTDAASSATDTGAPCVSSLSVQQPAHTDRSQAAADTDAASSAAVQPATQEGGWQAAAGADGSGSSSVQPAAQQGARQHTPAATEAHDEDSVLRVCGVHPRRLRLYNGRTVSLRRLDSVTDDALQLAARLAAAEPADPACAAVCSAAAGTEEPAAAEPGSEARLAAAEPGNAAVVAAGAGETTLLSTEVAARAAGSTGDQRPVGWAPPAGLRVVCLSVGAMRLALESGNPGLRQQVSFPVYVHTHRHKHKHRDRGRAVREKH